jgi:uncharacterized protein
MTECFMRNVSEFNLTSNLDRNDLGWFCEPGSWSTDSSSGELRIKTESNTDFWQRTHYGFQADNGHFLHLPVSSDFIATTKVTARGIHQYDQAGLMLRLSKDCWIKTSIEYEPEESNRLGVVVTNHQYSDWSTQNVSKECVTTWFRMHVTGATCIVQSSFDGFNWQQLRVAHISQRDQEPMRCGIYACSPKSAGFETQFHFLDIQASVTS